MAGVAETALEVAAAETQEHGRSSGKVAFSLKGIEYFVNAIHWCVVRLGESIVYGGIACCVTLAFLHIHTVAVGYLLAYPSGYILGGRIEGEELVEITVVKVTGDTLFDVGEIHHHTVAVELLGAAMHGDNPVVSMHPAALALVGELKPVASRQFKSFGYIVHLCI